MVTSVRKLSQFNNGIKGVISLPQVLLSENIGLVARVLKKAQAYRNPLKTALFRKKRVLIVKNS